jgi:hypothetical protein
MAILSTGNTFGATDTVTSTKLNNIANAATFDDPVDDSTLELYDGKLRVKDNGVGTTQIAPSSVTKAKIENVANMKVLGNTSGSATAPQEVSVLDEDNMASDSATALATQQSIKAYVDSAPNFTPSTYAGEESVTLPNGLIMKWGVVEDSPYGNTGVNIVTFGTEFPTAIINVQASWSTTSTSFTNPVYIKGNSVSTTGLTINNLSGTADVYWQAIGY